jgi:rubrerythrin
MDPHTFESIGPQTWKCLSCGRVEKVMGEDQPPLSCPKCTEIEHMDTVKVPPFSASDLEPPAPTP